MFDAWTPADLFNCEATVYAGQVVNLARFLCARRRVGQFWHWRARRAVQTGAKVDNVYAYAAKGPQRLPVWTIVDCPNCGGQGRVSART